MRQCVSVEHCARAVFANLLSQLNQREPKNSARFRLVLFSQSFAAVSFWRRAVASCSHSGSRRISVVRSAVAEQPVLALDGDGDFLELSPSLFTDVDELTVEGWVNWHSFQRWSRFFDFGSFRNGVSINQYQRSPDAVLHLAQAGDTLVSGVLRTNDNDWAQGAESQHALEARTY